MKKSLTKRLEDIENGVNTVTDTNTIRVKLLYGKAKLTPDEIRILEADDNGFSERAERIIQEIDKADELYQKQIEDLKHVEETIQIEDKPVEKKDEPKRYRGNTNPLMGIDDLPEFFRSVDYSQGAETF